MENFSAHIFIQVKKNQKLWDHKVKALLKREEDENENEDDHHNPNDADRQ